MEGSSNSGQKATLALRPLVGMFPRRLQQYVEKCTSLRCLVCSAGLIEFEETSAMTHDDLSNLSFQHIILSTNGRITLRSLTENQRSDKEATQASPSRVSIPYSYLVAMASVFRTITPVATPFVTLTLIAP